MKIVRPLLVAAVAIIVISCGRRRERDTIRIDVVRSSEGLQFRFGLCSGRSDDAMVTRFEIVRDGADASTRDVCGAYSVDDRSLGRAWSYGQRKNGLSLRGCAELGRGKYIASAIARNQENQGGFRNFRINQDGSVGQFQNSCERGAQ
jgi:hypothetical protein